MRRLLPALVALLVVAPAAQARSFDAEELSGSLVYRAAAGHVATFSSRYVAAGASITGPPGLSAAAIRCVSGAALRRCAKLTPIRGGMRVAVKRPVLVLLTARGPFTVRVVAAARLRGVMISGAGVVQVSGSGAYSADDAAMAALAPALGTVTLRLEG